MQWPIPIHQPDWHWTPPDLSSLPSWKGAKRVGFDFETCDPQLKRLGGGPRYGATAVGYSFCLDGGPAYYVPFRHLGGGNVDEMAAVAYLHDQMRDFEGEVVGANLPYDLDFLLRLGCFPHRARRIVDVQVAAALLNSLHMRYSLQHIAERAGLEGKDEGLLRMAAVRFQVDPKAEMWKLPAAFVGPYAEVDASLPLAIWEKQRQWLRENFLDEVWDLESRLTPILVLMRDHGVRVDFDAYERLRKWTLGEEAEALALVKRETGVTIKVGETSQDTLLDRALQTMNIVAPRTAKTGKASIKDAWLEALDIPMTRALARARAVAKLRGTFIDGTLKFAVNGRVYPTIKQLANDDGGARFGRSSCLRPNFQNQPAKGTELGDMLRDCILPDEGMEWCSADYSAQEPRMAVHWAAKWGVEGAAKAKADYIRDPDLDFHKMTASAMYGKPISLIGKDSPERKYSKVIGLGLMYSMGSGKLAESMKLPTQPVSGGRVIAGPEAMRLISRYHDGVPFVRGAIRAAEKQAKEHGFIRTLLGRICLFPKDDEGRYDWTHTALNRVIQGSSADQTKKAMVVAWEAGLRIQLQIHDELTMSTASRDEGEALRDAMVSAVTLSVPTRVDVEYGETWAKAQKVEDEQQADAEGDAFWEDAPAKDDGGFF